MRAILTEKARMKRVIVAIQVDSVGHTKCLTKRIYVQINYAKNN